jgi:hypothetical protein
MKIGNFAASIIKIISDNFNRTTTGSLGAANTGQTWNAIRGAWFANGTRAQTSDAASTYPIASIPFASSATLSADVFNGGVGLSYWTSDANNWWASVPNYVQNNNSVFTCNAAQVTNTSNPPSGSCCSTVTTTPGGQVCDAGYTSSTNPGIFCSITSTTPASQSCNANQQTQTTTSGFCGGFSTNPGSSSCNANYATGLSNTSSCCGPATGGTVYSCPAGGTYDNAGSCNVPQRVVSPYGTNLSNVQSCLNQGGSYSSANGGTCTFPAYSYAATATTTYACFTQVTTTPTTYTGFTQFTYYPAIYYGYTSTTQQPTQYSCFTQTTETVVTTYTTQIRMISSISGNIVTESTSNIVVNSATLSPVQSLKVDMLNGTVTTTAYSSPGLVGPINNPLVVTPSSPSTAPGVGIIRTPSNFNQGDSVDNFQATIQ